MPPKSCPLYGVHFKQGNSADWTKNLISAEFSDAATVSTGKKIQQIRLNSRFLLNCCHLAPGAAHPRDDI